MQKIKNFDIVINRCLWKINQELPKSDLERNDFILSVINGFEDGKWRKSEFRKFILDNIAQTGLSAEDRENLYSSEIAEIVLYGIMRYHYHALPVVLKIFYKQNPKDNAKGADSVHVVLDEKGDFSLWLGEAKFYNDIADERMYEPINSVFDTISTDKIKKENSIITSIKDLEYVITDPVIRKNVQTVLRRETSIDEIRKRLHVPILLLHECKRTSNATELTEAYLNDIKEYHLSRAKKYFESQNNRQKKENIYGYEHIQFHLILFPVPQKEGIVNWFVERAKQIKEDA